MRSKGLSNKKKAGDGSPAPDRNLLVVLVLLVHFMLVAPVPISTLPFALQPVEVNVRLVPLL